MQFQVKLFINNCLKISKKSDPITRKKCVDGIAQKEKTRKGKAIDGYRYACAIRAAAYPVDTGHGHWVSRQDGLQGNLFSSPDRINPRLEYIPDIKYVQSVVEPLGNGHYRVKEIDTEENLAAARRLVHIYKKSRQKTRRAGGWGLPSSPKAFGRYARHSLLEAGAVVDRLYPLAATRMVTLTIPGSTDAALKAVASYSGWIIDRLFRPVRRVKNSDGSPSLDWFFVWEFQGRGALHLHCCLASKCPKLTARVADDLVFDWFELLLEIREKTGVDCFARYYGGTWRNSPHKWVFDNQVCRKSVAAYFSKYASKTAADEKREKTAKAYGMYFPSRFWGSSSNIKKVAHSHRIDVVIDDLNKDECEFLCQSFQEIINIWEPVINRTFNYQIESPSNEQYCHSTNPNTGEITVDSRIVSTSVSLLASGEINVRYYQQNDYQELYEGVKELLGTPAIRRKREDWLHRIVDDNRLTSGTKYDRLVV